MLDVSNDLICIIGYAMHFWEAKSIENYGKRLLVDETHDPEFRLQLFSMHRMNQRVCRAITRFSNLND